MEIHSLLLQREAAAVTYCSEMEGKHSLILCLFCSPCTELSLLLHWGFSGPACAYSLLGAVLKNFARCAVSLFPGGWKVGKAWAHTEGLQSRSEWLAFLDDWKEKFWVIWNEYEETGRKETWGIQRPWSYRCANGIISDGTHLSWRSVVRLLRQIWMPAPLLAAGLSDPPDSEILTVMMEQQHSWRNKVVAEGIRFFSSNCLKYHLTLPGELE